MIDPLSRVFAALADPIRRDMVARLAAADATVGELAEPYAVSLQAVSKHLKVLEAAGLVSRSREAQRRPGPLDAQAAHLRQGHREREDGQGSEDDDTDSDQRFHSGKYSMSGPALDTRYR